MPFKFSTASRYLSLCVLLEVASLASYASGQTVAYANPAGANDFAVDANWIGGVAPTGDDLPTIDGVDGIANYCYLETTRSIQRFTLASNNGNSGGLELRSGGNLSATASGVSYVGARGPAYLRLLSGSSLTTGNTLFVGWGDVAGHGTGTVTQSGGSVSTTAGITMGVSAADINFPASVGTYNLNNGTVNLGGTLVVGHAGTGTFNMSGGSVTTGNFLQIGRTGNGTFTQTAGPLIVNRTSGDAMVIGAVAGGVGKYEISGGSLAVNTTGVGGVTLGVSTTNATGTFKVVGNGATSISITGDYKQYLNSNLAVDIGTGITPINLTGNATLGGALNVKFTASPNVGQQFTIMSYGGTLAGNFSTFDNLVDGPAGLNSVPLAISYGSGSADSIIVKVVPHGDYDRNGIVETADYNLWRQQFGAVGPSNADGNGDSIVNGADYVIWRNNLGAGSGSAVGQSMPVPEPGTICICLCGFAALLVLSDFRR